LELINIIYKEKRSEQLENRTLTEISKPIKKANMLIKKQANLNKISFCDSGQICANACTQAVFAIVSIY
jgi:hypothetical protein